MLFQSKECQTTHWQVHKPICRPYSPKEVWGVTILSNREVGKLDMFEHRKRYRHELVQIDHPVFTQGELCPVPDLFGIPLLIHSPVIATGKDIKNGGNQPAVYLRIEPKDGLAPIPCVHFNCYVVLISTRVLNTGGRLSPRGRYANG